MTGDAVEVLRLGDRAVAEYAWRPDLPASLAPRPYLHPVRTLGGTTVTELMPASHRHHLGVSVAVAEVDGVNFWGGRTFLPGHGPAWLDNQGSQVHLRWIRRRPGQLVHRLRWNSIDGSLLFDERRTLSWRPAGADAWALDFAFSLVNAAERELPIRSPAAHGRAGAGYGGFFWRAPSGECRVTAAEQSGAVHGGRARWVSVAGAGWTLVFLGADEATRGDRWFVRTRDYVGVGSSLAWDEPLLLPPGAALERRIVTVIADGDVSPGRAAAYAGEFSA